MNASDSNSTLTLGPAPRKDRATFVQELAIDVTIAAASDVPVLITGSPHRTLAFARLIVERGHTGSGLRVCDVARGDDVFNAIEGPHTSHVAATVVLREVQYLSESQQAVLADLIADRQDPRSLIRRRLIATSSVSLLHRVKHGMFDARLLYLLNAIHIVVRPARDYEPADREGVLWLPSSNELSRDRFRNIRTLSGAPPLLASIIDILSATSKKR